MIPEISSDARVGMFGLFKKQPPAASNGLFLVIVKVGRGTNTQMPASLKGAYVPALAAAPDYKAAAKAVASKVLSHGFELIDIQGPIKQLDPRQWSSFVRSTWPELEAQFPSEELVLAGMAKGAVFFGPFAGYEQSA